MTTFDPDLARAHAFRVWSYKQGEMVSVMIHLGDRLGLYRALWGAGRVTAAELAARTGLNERWLLEWLRGQAAAELIASDDGERFELTPEQAAVLADEESSILFAAGAFSTLPHPSYVDGIADAFRTGIGLPYDAQGPSGAHRTERSLGPWSRLALVPKIIPAIEGLEARLTEGAVVVDVGCGAGVALRAMAGAFPASRFVGYDPSHHAIEIATERVAADGLRNIELHESGAEALPQEPTFDFVITFDCLHDMTHPERAIAAIRRAIRPDGIWLIKEVRCSPSFAENQANPMLAMFYGFSVLSCMSSALSEPEGAGLGTVGFHPARAKDMCKAAGFSTFRIHDFEDPANLYYEVRP